MLDVKFKQKVILALQQYAADCINGAKGGLKLSNESNQSV